MNLRLCCLFAVISLASLPARAEDDFKTALQGQLSPREALPVAEKYVKDHPNAADAPMAKMMLGKLYAMNGSPDKAVTVLEQCYTALVKGSQGDLKNAVTITSELVESHLAAGHKPQAEAAINHLIADFKDNPEMTLAVNYIEGLKGELNTPGKGEVFDLHFTDIDGHPVDLASLKGKVVLVDFWATWCSICVQQLPGVLSAYKNSHDKGFEVVGISLDQDETTMRDFIRKRQMGWPQSFDGKGWDGELATKFGIHSLPSTFLLDKTGKVAATNLHGEALQNKIDELLK